MMMMKDAENFDGDTASLLAVWQFGSLAALSLTWEICGNEGAGVQVPFHSWAHPTLENELLWNIKAK